MGEIFRSPLFPRDRKGWGKGGRKIWMGWGLQFEGWIGWGGKGKEGGRKGEEDLARWLLQGPLLLKLFSFYNPVRIIYNLSTE